MTYTNDKPRHKQLSMLALTLLAAGNIISHNPGLTIGQNAPGSDHSTHHQNDNGSSGDHHPQHETEEKSHLRFWRSRRHKREFKPRW